MPVTFPAFCPDCGLVFQSSLLAITENVTRVVMEGNRERCPRCGGWAELPDGTFNVAEDTIHVLSASNLTRQRLAQLAHILDSLKAGAITEEQAAAQAPELAPLFERYRPLMRKALVAFLWFVFQTATTEVVAQHFDHGSSPAQVQQIVETAIQKCVSERP